METAKERYKKMSDALKATGMNFYFNICEWGEREPWLWAANAGGHSWRVSFDSCDTWDHGKYDGSHCGVIQSIDIMKNLDYYAGPNQFNDADMMCVGLYEKGKPSSASGARSMTDTEYQSQFSMWCMFSTPLLISFDLFTMNRATLDIHTNKELIANNQERLGQQTLCFFTRIIILNVERFMHFTRIIILNVERFIHFTGITILNVERFMLFTRITILNVERFMLFTRIIILNVEKFMLFTRIIIHNVETLLFISDRVIRF